MFQNILLCTDGSAGADGAADYAIWLAQRLKARLRALHVTDVRLLEGPLLSDLAGAIGAQPYSALLPQLQEIQRTRAETVLNAVQQRCAAAGVECELIQQTGRLTQVLLEQEQESDLVTLGQRGEHAELAWESLGSSVERMVRASVKPCLVCPGKFQEIKHVLMAYDGSGESSRALRRGIELAEAVGARMTVITAYETAEEKELAEKVVEQARLQVANRQVAVAAELTHGSAEEQIISECARLNADLIVMGAYGHTRIRSLILGSTTTHVMRHAATPVLLSRQ